MPAQGLRTVYISVPSCQNMESLSFSVRLSLQDIVPEPLTLKVLFAFSLASQIPQILFLQVCPVSDKATAQDWSDADGSGKLSRKELEASMEMIKRQEMARVMSLRLASQIGFRACGDALGKITDEARVSVSIVSHSQIASM